MNKFQEVYDKNKELDKLFYQEYGNNADIVLKNKLELLVELGELANESRCFKYWSNKKVNRESLLEEYADVVLMILYFFRELNISLSESFPSENNLELLDEFIYLFNVMSKLTSDYGKDVLKDIFVNTLRLGKLLNITDTEIIDSCLNKINIDKERFNIDY